MDTVSHESRDSERAQLLPAPSDATEGSHDHQLESEHASFADSEAVVKDDMLPDWHGVAPKLGATAFNFLVSGLAMAAIGVLIPDIEHYYGTNDATTAWIFPASMLGYVVSTATVHKWHQKLGNRGVAIVSSAFRLLASLLLATAPPFGVALPIYGCFGYGTGLTDIAWNNWASSTTSRPNILQGLLHGCFSVGCVLGPLLAAGILEGHRWSVFYLVMGALCGIELSTQAFVFRRDLAPARIPSIGPDVNASKSFNPLRSRVVLMCGLYLFLYQGIEATTTDWIVVYVRRVQHTSTTVAGSASSAFWIGMTIGRYSLGAISERFGVERSVAVYSLSLLLVQILLSVIDFNTRALTSLLAVSGFFAGPLFPSAIILLVSRLRSQARSAIGSIAAVIAMGQLGGALAPLLMGAIASGPGIRHLFEVTCGIALLLFISWMAFTRVHHCVEHAHSSRDP